MNNFTVVFDACVLVPMHLRNLFMWMALSGLFRAKWSEDIHKEWMRNVIKIRQKKGLSETQLLQLGSQIEQTRKDMDSSILDSLVTGYEPIVQSLIGINMKDRHVLAAAIVAKAQTIVTYNLKDFPAAALNNFGIQAVHPDHFLTDLSDLNSEQCLLMAEKARAHLKKPPIDMDDYFSALEKLELSAFVSFLRANTGSLKV